MMASPDFFLLKSPELENLLVILKPTAYFSRHSLCLLKKTSPLTGSAPKTRLVSYMLSIGAQMDRKKTKAALSMWTAVCSRDGNSSYKADNALLVCSFLILQASGIPPPEP